MWHLNKPNYRIYALLIGEIIKSGKIFNCEVQEMNFTEQAKRKFSPIQSIFSQTNDSTNYKTYVTSLPYVDPVKIKSNYVIICDIQEHDAKAALGAAVKRIDRICRFLTLAYAEDINRKFKRAHSLLPYLYQVNKIYSLDLDGNESDINFKLKSHQIYLPNRPELNEWRCLETQRFLEDMFNFHDEILERATKYLYRSAIGIFIKDSPEKIALDHFKSIEIIISSLSRKSTFKTRVDDVAVKLNFTDEEKKAIKQCWDDRSNYSDTAHPSAYDQAERYSNQFPLPSNVQYPYGFRDPIAGSVCVKYFLYKKSLFRIDINSPWLGGREETLSEFNSWWESNHLLFETLEANESILKQKLIQTFASHYKIKESDVYDVTWALNKKAIFLRVKNVD